MFLDLERLTPSGIARRTGYSVDRVRRVVRQTVEPATRVGQIPVLDPRDVAAVVSQCDLIELRRVAIRPELGIVSEE